MSANYYDVTRQQNQAFSFNVGIVRNLNGDKEAYTAYCGGAGVSAGSDNGADSAVSVDGGNSDNESEG